ncbi:MAG: DNA polymerase III subunit delta [Peptococcaceae bacterium]|nr:DNA polymerase III subunit delta [Peptococcaceae bacterium]
MARPARKTIEEATDYSNLIARLKAEGPRPVYLLCGQETYLQERLISAVAGAWLEEEISDFNFVREDGAKLTAGQAADSANQVSFFSAKKLLLIENPGFITYRKESAGAEDQGEESAKADKTVEKPQDAGKASRDQGDSKQLMEYLQNPSPATCLIFWCRQAVPDKRDKYVKAVGEAGGLVILDQARPGEAMAFLKAMAEKAGKSCTVALLEQIISGSPLGLSQAVTEMDKLISYSGGEKLLTPQMAQEVLTPTLEANIFRMVDALGQKRAETAIRELRSLLDQGQSPYGIFAMMLRQFRLLIRTKAYLAENYSRQQIAQLMKQRPFVIDKAAGQCRTFSDSALIRAMEVLQTKDLAMKSGGEPRQVLEDLILELARLG